MRVWARLGACFSALVMLAGFGFSQGSTAYSDPPTIVDGVFSTYPYTSGGTTYDMPWQWAHTTTVASPGSGYSVVVECVRTHGFNRLTGQLYPISPPTTVYSLSYGYQLGTRTVDLDQPFWNWWGSRTNPDEKFGRFSIKLSYRPASGSYTVVSDLLVWIIRQADDLSSGGGGTSEGGGSGGGSLLDGLLGILEDAFVPSEDCLSDLSESADNLKNWGPFGWYGVITGRIQDNQAFNAPIDDDYHVAINVPEHSSAVGVGGTYDLDLSPYEGVLKFVRVIIAGGLWWAAAIAIWKLVKLAVKI